jgi:TolA-binding protein
MAALLRADAFFRLERFEDAGLAYESAAAAAREAGVDSLERRATAAVPVAYFRHAQSAATKDSSAHERNALLFERVASRWPTYEHAHLAQYRAALAWLAAGSRANGLRALEGLIQTFPNSEYVRDARLQIGHVWEGAGEPARAADAWMSFVRHYPEDSTAAEALLRAADLFDQAGQTARSDSVRLDYVSRYPGDVRTGLETYERLARRELAALAERPISTLLPPPTKARVQGAKEENRTSGSHLGEYLKRAAARPELASRDLMAEVRFRMGEERRDAYLAARLTQPLEKSIPVRQARLDSLIAAYKRAADLGSHPWAQASAYRIGEALVAFGEALETSERPADLSGDDLAAYEEVLFTQAGAFHTRGEQVWTDLLRAAEDSKATSDWVAKARDSLWGRLAQRFYFMPEAEYPVARATPAEPKRSEP